MQRLWQPQRQNANNMEDILSNIYADAYQYAISNGATERQAEEYALDCKNEVEQNFTIKQLW